MATRIRLLCLQLGVFACLTLSQAQVTNGGFETPQISPNSWVDNPTNFPGWLFTGRSGVGNGSTPLAPGAYAGTQYAFLATQGANGGKMSQTIGGMTPGANYRLRFWMRTRPGFAGIELGVRMNGNDIMTPCHSFGIWLEYATDWFVAPATSATFEFYADNSANDKLTVIDEVRLDPGPPPAPGLPLNGSYESPAMPVGNWFFLPADLQTVWKFHGAGGIANGPGSWGTNAADGLQYAFLQNTSYCNQVIGIFNLDKSYHVEYYMARRSGNVGGNDGNPIRVLLDQTEIAPSVFYDNPNWRNFASKPFMPTNLTGLLQIEGLNNNGDRTELIDHVRIFENVDLSPTAYELVQGTYISGNVSSVAYSDDQYLKLAPGLNLARLTPPIQVVFEATSPSTTVTYFAMALESACSLAGLNQRIELWDAVNRQWVLASQTSPANVDGTVHIVRSDDAALFVDQTTGKIRCRVSMAMPSPTGSRTWQYRIDQVKFAITPF